MRSAKFRYGTTLTALLWASGSASTWACAFHGYTPNPTLVDLLLTTEHAVIARPAPTGQQQYRTVEALIGPAVEEIALSGDGGSGNAALASANAEVLFARDGAYGPWMPIAVMDSRFRGVVDVVMQRQAAWQSGRDADRLSFFAAYVNDPNPDLRHLALRELDRVDYATLQGTRLPQIKNLRRDLATGGDDLRPIRILLAGLSGDRGYSDTLAEGLAQAVARDLPYLGAYATALVELEGPAGVHHIAEKHLVPDHLLWGAREKLLQALFIQHRSAPPATRQAITRELARLSRGNPDFAEAAERQFGSISRWRSAPSVPAATGDR